MPLEPPTMERSMNHFAKIAFACILLSVTLPCRAKEGATTEAPAPVYPLSLEGPKPAAITPPTATAIHESIWRGVEFLLQTQREEGAWGSIETKRYGGIYVPLVGSHHAFRTAVTSLSTMALVEAAEQFTGTQRDQIELAIDRGQQWLLQKSGTLRRGAPNGRHQLVAEDKYLTLYSVWGHAYAIQAIVPLHRRAHADPTIQGQLKELLKYHVDRLHRNAFIDGGWGYYDMRARTRRPSGSSSSFTTATVLIAMKEAKELGVEFPEDLLEKAIASILRQRYPDFAYAYGEYLKMSPRYGINRPAGSLGRSQACNLALRLYGDKHVSDDVLRTWLDRLYARNGWLSIGRKYPIPHESHFGVAGYFFYYGHFYAAMCIEELPLAERPHFQEHLAHILLPLQEKDGSWWDYPLYNYHQQYGTAMAISSLVRCQQESQTPSKQAQ